jgi:nicotinate-nucleotide adenylyltransferase
MPLPKVALYGGAFNPVHRGHLDLADSLTRRFKLSRLVFVPTGHPTHRDMPEDPGCLHRLRMIEEAIRYRSAWEASDFECRNPEPSYTIRTLETLFPDTKPWLILGADAFLGFSAWHRFGGILDRSHLMVAGRPGVPADGIREAFSKIRPFGPFPEPDGSEWEKWTHGLLETILLKGLDPVPFRVIAFVQAGTPDISSTVVREALQGWASGKEIPDRILPAQVKSYIVEEGLFGVTRTFRSPGGNG